MNDEMTPTKTYPLSAIMGEEITDKERIAELQNAFEDAVTRAERQRTALRNWKPTSRHCGNPVLGL